MSAHAARHRLDELFYESHFIVRPAHPSPNQFPGRHAFPSTNSDYLPIGAVWFSYVSEAWRRRTGRAVWDSVIIATAEQIWHMRRRA